MTWTTVQDTWYTMHHMFFNLHDPFYLTLRGTECEKAMLVLLGTAVVRDNTQVTDHAAMLYSILMRDPICVLPRRCVGVMWHLLFISRPFLSCLVLFYSNIGSGGQLFPSSLRSRSRSRFVYFVSWFYSSSSPPNCLGLVACVLIALFGIQYKRLALHGEITLDWCVSDAIPPCRISL